MGSDNVFWAMLLIAICILLGTAAVTEIMTDINPGDCVETSDTYICPK